MNLRELSEQFSKEMQEKYKDSALDAEESLVADIREFSKGSFLFPFLETFLNQVEVKIHSRYILKILLGDWEKLQNKDVICFDTGDLEEEDVLPINNDFVIVKGTILRQLLRQNLTKTLQYITSEVGKIPPSKIGGEEVFLFSEIDPQKVSALVYEEYEGKKDVKLLG